MSCERETAYPLEKVVDGKKLHYGSTYKDDYDIVLSFKDIIEFFKTLQELHLAVEDGKLIIQLTSEKRHSN